MSVINHQIKMPKMINNKMRMMKIKKMSKKEKRKRVNKMKTKNRKETFISNT